MRAAEFWAGGIACALVLLASVYLAALFRALRNEQVIGAAIVAMRAALDAGLAPQRALLAAIADTLAAQERAAARIEVAVHELAVTGQHAPPWEDLVKELLDLPEPQLLVTDFLGEHGGGPGSEAALGTVAADLLRTATVKVFGELADHNMLELERLLLLAAEGRIAAVAMAGRDAVAGSGAPAYQAPRVADLDAAALLALVRALDQTIRRHLRLATLLESQAEAILRIRRDDQRGLARLRTRALQVMRYPRVRRPEFHPSDLEAVVIALDAVGEVVDTAAEQLAGGEPMRAVHLLAGLRVPVPAGLPGRIYHQESLALVRPLAAFGVWHRLAVSRWAACTLRAIAPADTELAASGAVSAGPPDHGTRSEGGSS